ncbi:orotidine-5'-phosphate decarboxylase [Aerococcaceae bacterium DSM 111022]|nr:orotidine-5'-phosphate decarboxylase [Aerococcaceae bacterium DSM 111022]
MKKELPIIALDFPNGREALEFVDLFNSERLNVKIGMELFYIEGPKIVYELKKRGHHIFLDLKLHDIPNTVKSAMASLARLEVDMVTVHCPGGSTMLKAAVEGLTDGTPANGKRPIIVGITQLTSTSPEQVHTEQLVDHKYTLEESVIHYATIAKKAGLDGVVSSPLEAKHIKEAVGYDFQVITPGIRPELSNDDDQKRIATPHQAAHFMSDYLVIGRPITQAVDPVTSYHQMKDDWNKALLER